jgi:hypothetical protein
MIDLNILDERVWRNSVLASALITCASITTTKFVVVLSPQLNKCASTRKAPDDSQLRTP